MSSFKKSSLKRQPASFLMAGGGQVAISLLLKFYAGKAFLLISFFAFSAHSFYRIDTLTKEDEAQSRAIWSIKKNSRNLKMGTAFFISPTQVITNFHVLDSFLKSGEPDLTEDLFLTHHNIHKVFRFKKIIRLSQLYDLALLEVDQESPYFLNLVANSSPSDSDLYVIGYHNSGHSQHGEFDKFKQTSPLIDLDYGEMTINHSSLKGLSGSPVLLNDMVRGVVSISFKNLLHFISVNDLKNFLNEPAFLCHESSTAECLHSAKKLFINNPKQDLKYYYNLFLTVFTPEMIRTHKTEPEKKEFWNRFEIATTGLEKLKETKNSHLLFHILTQYYHFNSYRLYSSKSDKTHNRLRNRMIAIEKGALLGERQSQYILSYINTNPEENAPPSSYPLLSSNKTYWLLKAGQNSFSQAQYELGRAYYRYHQNPFLNDFILSAVIHEESRLFENQTDLKELLFQPSLNFNTEFSQWLKSRNSETARQAQTAFKRQTAFYTPFAFNQKSPYNNNPIDISGLLEKLSNPYNPYQTENTNPIELKGYDSYKEDSDRFQATDIDFPLFKYRDQKKSLLAPEDQSSIQSYKDLLAWIDRKEKKVYREMTSLSFNTKLSEITGCDPEKSPLLYPPDPENRTSPYPQNPLGIDLEGGGEKATAGFNTNFLKIDLEGRTKAALNFLLGKYWLTKAAEQGHPEAQYLLGELYAKNKNLPLAEYWLIKALNQNQQEINHHSLYLLGLMRANVREVNKKRNTCLARFWLQEAMSLNDYRAENALRKIVREEYKANAEIENDFIIPFFREEDLHLYDLERPYEEEEAPYNLFKEFYEEFESGFFATAFKNNGGRSIINTERDNVAFMGDGGRNIDALGGDDESLLFNSRPDWIGEVLIDRNSHLLNQGKETDYYVLSQSEGLEPPQDFKSLPQQTELWDFQAYIDDEFYYFHQPFSQGGLFVSIEGKRRKIDLNEDSAWTHSIGGSMPKTQSIEAISLEDFLKERPEMIYQIAEESSLLWSGGFNY